MFTDIARAFGYITLEQTSREITLKGLPADVMEKDIAKIWSTNRINDWMFSRRNASSVSFPHFFALELHYMLQQIEEDEKSGMRSSAIRKVRTLLETETWIAKTKDDTVASIVNLNALRNLAWTAKPHQLDFIKRYGDLVPRYSLNGFMLAADPGTGKTFTGLALAEALGADLVLVVCPKKAVYDVWDATIKANFKGEVPWISIDDLPIEENLDRRFYVSHYEQIHNLLKLIKLRHPAKRVMIILDESHNMNEINSGRTQAFVDLCAAAKSQHVLWMSGTPIKAMGSEMVPFLRTVDPLFTPEAEVRFLKIFGNKSNRANDILAHRLGLVLHKVPKSVVMEDTKPITKQIKVTIPKSERFTLDALREEMRIFVRDQMAKYGKEMAKFEKSYADCLDLHKRTLRTNREFDAFTKYQGYIRTIKSGYDPALMKVEAKYCNEYELKTILPSLPANRREEFRKTRSAIKYLDLKVRGEALGVLTRRRSECHMEMIKHGKLTLDGKPITLAEIIMEAEKKTVIFSSYVQPIKEAHAQLKAQGFAPEIVFQDTNSHLNDILARFKQAPECNPLVTTYKSLGDAVPLISANTMVLIDLPFREYIQKQAIARIDRLGQDTQTYVFEMLLDTGRVPNISTRSADILAWCTDQVRTLMGDEMKNVDVGELVMGFTDDEWSLGALFTKVARMFGNLF